MKFLIKQISPSKTEIRIVLNSIDRSGTPYYMFGSVDGNFDNGTISTKYIPFDISSYFSSGPNPAIIRLIVAYLKDTLGTMGGFNDTVLTINNGKQHIPIVNIAVDDINLINLSSDTIPSIVIKLAEQLPDSVVELDEVYIEKLVLTTQEQDIYYIPDADAPLDLKGLDYDESMKDEVVNKTDNNQIEYQSYNQLTASFNHADDTILGQILSGSDPNLRVDYSEFKNHVHFGSAVSKIENFKTKVSRLEDHLLKLSQSLQLTSSKNVDNMRRDLFKKIQTEKNSFTLYEKKLYYEGDTLGFKYNINLGNNYIANDALNKTNYKKLLNYSGFNLVHKTSGSNIGDGIIPLFRGKYNVEDKPFYNWSGSFYLSFLMKGDEGMNGNIVWDNYQEKHTPPLPYKSFYSSSVSQPTVSSSRWQRYTYLASSSYWTPSAGKPIVGTAGSIGDFSKTSTETVNITTPDKTGSHGIKLGGRYSNLATTVTSSGVYFTGSIVPAGELFRIYVNTNQSTAVTSSYLTDIKISKYNPASVLPFSEVHRTGSAVFQNWYNEQYESASLFDQNNQHALIYSLPEFLQNNNQMDNTTFKNFIHLTGEYFDLIKVYIDNYPNVFKRDYIDKSASNLLPILAKQSNWNFMLPFSKTKDTNLLGFMGSTLSHVDNNLDVKENIWRNVLNNLNYINKSKGTHRAVRSLLNSYGFPPDILKLREHGASLESSDSSVLANDASNLSEGLSRTTGNQSFTVKSDKMVSYIIDNSDRKIGAEWHRDSVDADAVEFIFKPTQSPYSQIILENSGSIGETLWDLILEPSASTSIKSRLTFRLNNKETGSANIATDANTISMSTDYHSFKNNNFWNVLLQRTAGPSGSDTYTSHSYELFVGEQIDDRIRTLQKVSMSFGGNVYSHSAANWFGTGSRHIDSASNFIIGETYTGSIAEFRTWKYALSSSKFKQHIYDKKSVVGNTLNDSQTNLIYHYRLNENYNPGFISKTSLLFTSASNQYVNLGTNSLFSSAAASFTFWIKPTSTGYEQNIFAKDEYSGDIALRLTGTGTVRWYGQSGDPDSQTSSTALSVGTWYHIALTFDGTTAKIYINGVEDKSDTKSSWAFNGGSINSRQAWLGRDTGGTYLDSYLDEFAIFGRGLSAGEVTNIYNGGIPTDLSNKKDLVAYYRFEENSGTTATDLSSNSNNGTITNGASFSTDTPKAVRKIKDSNIKNLKDYSVEIQGPAFGTNPLYDIDEYDRIQFNIGIGGSQELSDNNIIVDAERRFIDNLNPFGPSVLNLQDPLVNKRKASSVIELIRSPQDVINDFIINQMGNSSFTDKFADPRDLYKPLYQDLEDFAKDFFDYYDISLDVNKYIRAQAVIFSKDLIKALKRLVPARANFGKIGIEIKSTHLERPKLLRHKIELDYADDGYGHSKYSWNNIDDGLIKKGDTDYTDWEKNTYSGVTIDNLQPFSETKKATIAIASNTGSLVKIIETYIPDKITNIGIASHTGSTVNETVEYIPNKNISIPVSSHTGSNPGYTYQLHTPYNLTIGVSSHTGSIPVYEYNITEDRNTYLGISSHTGSLLNETVEFVPNKNMFFAISSNTGSITTYEYEIYKPFLAKIGIASHSGSKPELSWNITKRRDVTITAASNTGSITTFDYEYVPNKTAVIGISSHSGSLPIWDYQIYKPLLSTIAISSHTGSIPVYEYEIEENRTFNIDTTVGSKNMNTDGAVFIDTDEVDKPIANLQIATVTGSVPNLLQEYKPNYKLNIAVATVTSSYPTITEYLIQPNEGNFNYIGNTEFVTKLNPDYSDISDKWGTTLEDVHFIANDFAGKDGYYNTWHYDKRTIFYTVGDVESISGSYLSVSSSFETDYFGTITNGVHTASRDIKNTILITNEIGLGTREMGTTVRFALSSSLGTTGGKPFDENFIYPPNHIFLVGTTKDQINNLIYDGTQNMGGDRLDSETFVDISDDAIYEIWNTGAEGYYTEGNY